MKKYKRMIVLLFTAAFAFGLTGCGSSSGSSSSSSSDGAETEAAEEADSFANGNVLMSVRLDNGKVSDYVFNNESLEAKQIVSITFSDSLSGMTDTAWDVSENRDGSVMAWTEAAADDTYNLYIAGDGGVCANTDSSFIFSSYEKAENIYFNGSFYTGETTDFSGMFMGCKSLKELDLSDFNTENAEDMSSMFYKCSSLTKLDLSSFDTSKVTDMSGMFLQCSSLTDLDVSSFDTSNVTDMSTMFSECGVSVLDLSSFDTSNVTNMGTMFFGAAI